MIEEQIKNSTARDVDEDVKLKQNSATGSTGHKPDDVRYENRQTCWCHVRKKFRLIVMIATDNKVF